MRAPRSNGVEWNGIVNDKRDKASEANPAQLHKKMLQLLSSLWVTRAVGTFARLGLADVMVDGVEDHAAIAAARGLVPDRVYRLLRALSTVGVVSEPARGRFALTPLGRLLSTHAPNNTRTTAIFLNDYFADMWSHLDDALTGECTAFEALKGRPFFDWLGEHPDEARRFNRMMLEVHGPETPAIVAAYDFSQCKHIVDVGGGNGSLLAELLKSHPELRGIVFDLPETTRDESLFGDGLEFVAGSFFERVPEGDAYLLATILHDWDDESATKILHTIRAAAPRHARLVILDAVVPPGNEPFGPKWLDLLMLTLFAGRERDEEQWRALLADGGFEPVRFDERLIEARCRS